RAFANLGVHVVGVEPNEAMLSEAREHPDCRDRIVYVKAAAEDTGLPADSFDLIACAQAFHWFDPDKALTEFHRMLKKGGWVALIWNERDETDAFTKQYGDLLRSWPDTSKVEMKRGKAGEPLLHSAKFNNRERHCFLHSHEMTLDKLIGRALSASYAPAPDSPEAESFSLKLRDLFAEFQKDNLVIMRYESS